MPTSIKEDELTAAGAVPLLTIDTSVVGIGGGDGDDETPRSFDTAFESPFEAPLTTLRAVFGPSCPLDSLCLAILVPLQFQVQFPLPLDTVPRVSGSVPGFEDELLAELDEDELPELDDESLSEPDDESLAEFAESLPESDEEELPELDDEPLPEDDDDPLPELDDDPLPEEDEDSLPELEDESLPELDEESLPELDVESLTELDDESLAELDDDPLPDDDDDELDAALDGPSKLPSPDPYGPSSNVEQSGNNCANPTTTPGPTAPKNCSVTPLSAHRSICTSFP